MGVRPMVGQTQEEDWAGGEYATRDWCWTRVSETRRSVRPEEHAGSSLDQLLWLADEG